MTEGEFGGLWTFVALMAFLSVCWWTYISRKKSDFDEAANLPFADDSPVGGERTGSEKGGQS